MLIRNLIFAGPLAVVLTLTGHVAAQAQALDAKAKPR